MSAPDKLPIRPEHEARVSVRWLFPFLRVTGASPTGLALLQREGIDLNTFANPETQIRHSVVMELLRQAVEREREPCLGLWAGERFVAGDLGVLEYTLRSCSNLRDSIQCAGRCMSLINEALESTLLERSALAAWELTTLDDVAQHPAANDFVVSVALQFARRNTGQRFPLREIHFRHAEPSNAAEYARVFDGANVRFSRAHNALVFDRQWLELPLTQAHTGLQAAFELRVHELINEARKGSHERLAERVRGLLSAQLSVGPTNMHTVSRQLAMSAATLRRKLAVEGTTFAEVLDKVRYELALVYLRDPSLAVREIAFLLGFAHVSAFYKAFSRRAKATPGQVRAQLQQASALNLTD